MKNNFQKGFIVPVLLGIIGILIIGWGVYFYTSKKVDAPIVINEVEEPVVENKEVVKKTETSVLNSGILGNKEDLVSFSVKAGDTISGLLKLSGVVKNVYFFEGNIGIGLLDANKNILKQGNGTATSNWMTVEPVSFTSTIDSTGLSGKGYIAIQEDDPSGGEGGPARKILIPVTFGNVKQETMSVKLYFGNRIYNPEMLDCRLVYPVTRIIPYTQSVATATLNELIKGPTVEEGEKGYYSNIPDGVKVNSIKMVGSTLSIDFNDQLDAGVGGSCGQLAKRSSLFTTLQQFPAVKDIKMTVNGKGETADFFQP